MLKLGGASIQHLLYELIPHRDQYTLKVPISLYVFIKRGNHIVNIFSFLYHELSFQVNKYILLNEVIVFHATDM